MGAGAGSALPVGRDDMRGGRSWRAPGGAAVGAGAIAVLPVGHAACLSGRRSGEITHLMECNSVFFFLLQSYAKEVCAHTC